jgi:hypothetical protein
MIDDGRHTAHQPTLLISQEEIRLAELERSILLAVEGIQHILQKIGYSIRVPLIEVVIETNKLAQVTLAIYFLNVYHSLSRVFNGAKVQFFCSKMKKNTLFSFYKPEG